VLVARQPRGHRSFKGPVHPFQRPCPATADNEQRCAAARCQAAERAGHESVQHAERPCLTGLPQQGLKTRVDRCGREFGLFVRGRVKGVSRQNGTVCGSHSVR